MDKINIKWKGKSLVDKTFLIAPMGPESPIMIFNSAGKLLLQKETNGFPAHFVQLRDLSGYSYFSGDIHVGKGSKQYRANGKYTVGKLYITDNQLNTVKEVDYIPTTKIPKVIGLHMHGNYVLGKDHYLLQAISFEEVEIQGQKSWVVNCIIQEQKNGCVIWEWQSIDEPMLFDLSFTRNRYFNKKHTSKEEACDYAHMNSIVQTLDGKYLYISFKHIGIVKLDYQSKKIVWVLGKNSINIKTNSQFKTFGHQHDLHLIADDHLYFWDNEHLSYAELKIEENTLTYYNTLSCPTFCKNSVMGNALRISDNVLDICYGMRMPFPLPYIYNQPIISEFDFKTGEKVLDITINDFSKKFLNIMYQINRGVNIYENK